MRLWSCGAIQSYDFFIKFSIGGILFRKRLRKRCTREFTSLVEVVHLVYIRKVWTIPLGKTRRENYFLPNFVNNASICRCVFISLLIIHLPLVFCSPRLMTTGTHATMIIITFVATITLSTEIMISSIARTTPSILILLSTSPPSCPTVTNLLQKQVWLESVDVVKENGKRK